MRIRTIKPEFWSHPVMARQDDAAKLLAIGLLNYADDEGFFYAEPSLIRNSLRAFDDDSSIVRRCLAQLAEIGFVELREHPTHGTVGVILSFSEHQRVDRPKPSRIKELYDSSINRRSIDDQSSLEGKGREQGTGNREGKELSSSLRSDSSGESDSLSSTDLAKAIWDAAPQKSRVRSSLKDCEKAMASVKVSNRPTAEDATAALAAWAECPDWQKDGGQFIPGLHRWIKAEQWRHVPASAAPKDFNF